MATRHGKTLDDVLYPRLEASKTGMLAVSELHSVYWEESGNSAGTPVMVLHGGPGGGSQPDYRCGQLNHRPFSEKFLMMATAVQEVLRPRSLQDSADGPEGQRQVHAPR